MDNDTILIIGSSRQIGSELTMALRKIYSNVIAADLKEPNEEVKQGGKLQRVSRKALMILSQKMIGDGNSNLIWTQ